MKVDKVETSKGNHLIADFMKIDLSQEWLDYHSNWNSLMGVVDHLHNKGCDIWINYKSCRIEWMDDWNSYELEDEHGVKEGIQGDTKIESVWNAIVYFIDWVNTEEVDLDNPSYSD